VRFLIIGNGVAGATAALTLRRREPDAAITLVGGESDFFFSRTALMYVYMDRLSRRDLEPYERQAWDRQAIRRVRGRVVDLDAANRTVRLASGDTLSYDRLLLATGSLPNRIPWPGLEAAREGVAHFVTLQDLAECERLTPSTREAVVVGGGLIGVELAECLVFHGKRVTFLVREPWYWPVALGGPESAMISQHLRRRGVDVRLEEEVAEVLTEPGGRVGGIRSNAGREYPCQMLGVTIGVHPAVEWLVGVTTPPACGRGILVRPDFATSLPGVWAAGDCAEIQLPGEVPLVEQIWYSARRQGELAARAMLGDPIEYRPPIFCNSAKFFEIEYTTVGMVMQAPADAEEFYCPVPGREASIRLVAYRGALIGCNLLGARWNHALFERWIAERRPLDYVVGHLGEAQFDVEFGRLDLSCIREAFRQHAQTRQSQPAGA